MRSRQRPVCENAFGRFNLADQLRQAFYVIGRYHRRDFLAFRRSGQCRSVQSWISLSVRMLRANPRTAPTQLVRELCRGFTQDLTSMDRTKVDTGICSER
jgi:hypothetical protein